LICIKGPKGVGKSTLILQHIRDTFKNIDDALFLSLDNLLFTTHDLYDVATCYYAHGQSGRYISWFITYPTNCDSLDFSGNGFMTEGEFCKMV